MRRRAIGLLVCAFVGVSATAHSQVPANPLWHEQKIKNYLPHMTWPEVRDLLTRTDMVIMPVTSIEQHGHQGPLGTDFFNGLEQAKLVAQKTDVLVAPILFPGNSPYHMGFAGTITLPAETIQLVFFQAAQSLIAHGFKRVLLLNSHGGNRAISRYVVDRINQETPGVAVELDEAAQPFFKGARRNDSEFGRYARGSHRLSDAAIAPPKNAPRGGSWRSDGDARVLGGGAESGKYWQGNIDQGNDFDGRLECSRCARRHGRARS
jgi:hypothetical protein